MTEQVRRWLTALVDGELAQEELDAVDDILRTSPPAREYLERLQQDAYRMKALTHKRLPDSFATSITDELRLRRLRTTPQRRPITRWFPAAAAAMVVVALGWCTYLLLNDMGSQARPSAVGMADAARNSETITNKQLAKAGLEPAAPRRDLLTVWEEFREGLPALEDARESIAQLWSLLDPVERVMRTGSTELARLYDVVSDEVTPKRSSLSRPSVLTSPAGITNPFKTVDVKLPLFLDVRTLETSKLLDKLREDSLFHLDLVCTDSWRALERFQTACRSAGVRLVCDAEVIRRSSAKQPAMYMVYLENVAPEQVSKLLLALQAEEKKSEGKPRSEPQFGSLMVQSLDEEGRKQLADLLGIAPSTLAPVRPRTKTVPSGLDPSKPLSDETMKSLQKLAAGQGTKPGEPTAVVVLYQTRSRPPLSKDIKDYLESRPGVQADAINVVFLLRPSRG